MRANQRTAGSIAPVMVSPRPRIISAQMATSAGWPKAWSTSVSVSFADSPAKGNRLKISSNSDEKAERDELHAEPGPGVEIEHGARQREHGQGVGIGHRCGGVARTLTRMPCRRKTDVGAGRATKGAAEPLAVGGCYCSAMELAQADRSILVVIDLQGKLVEKVHRSPLVLAATHRLLEFAQLFSVPVVLTEQYPRGLGPTHPELLARFEALSVPKRRFEKGAFGRFGEPGFEESLAEVRPGLAPASTASSSSPASRRMSA